MPAPLSRRRFTQTTLATGAGALLAAAGFHTSRTAQLIAAEKEILSKLTRLFPRLLLGDVKTEGTRSVEAAVAIDEVDAFLDPIRREAALPDVAIHASGNHLSFQHGETSYDLQILIPSDFAKRSGEPLAL